MTRRGLVVALLGVVVVVAGCARPGQAAVLRVPNQTTPTSVLVVPASSHVTGLPYPARCAARAGGELPDPACTPGAVRSDIDPSHLERTVCLKDWSASVRPPKTETDQLKTQAMTAYGEPPPARATTELDHLVPESLGGASDVKNLWPQVSDLPGRGFRNSKDTVEDQVHAWVCAGHQQRWADAVTAFTTDWRTTEQILGMRS